MALVDRKAQEAREAAQLAPWGMRSAASRGRAFPEREDAMRTCFQRDRDRVVHSSSFRRLEYKTQVFVNHEGDNYRTRLTHSLEGAQIGRSVARAMGLNEELTECLVLGHDLGHTPFGHSGERVMNELMTRYVPCGRQGCAWSATHVAADDALVCREVRVGELGQELQRESAYFGG